MPKRDLVQPQNSSNNFEAHKFYLGRKVAKLGLKVAIASIAILPLAAFGVSAAKADDSYGAISRSPSTEGKGYSWNYSTRAAAENRAYRECESVSGNGDCEVLLWFRNACGSIAESTTGAAGTGWGTSRSIAESYALDVCGDYSSRGRISCAVTRTICTPQ
ncbi:hypothetical protein Pse7367_3314 [Thalassoporum mexicanum PCC 7367]|uniref:DUF4189 domain-containing protein n=1 Tax=Thalassoporum mexicanum TaxID=3457544 RepID=UPI00029FED63|nr:DUF4189 domain-containing protein [Pseudanabaena sp. PCC 7367]AFY71554.1 hypothetical protein Pse7367_3314 [Pseudanabaena sp. PCC 7367]